MAEAQLWGERPKDSQRYGYVAPIRYHVGMGESKVVPCGVDPETLSGASGEPKEDLLCKVCVSAATMKAMALWEQAKVIEVSIGILRSDIESLSAHGPVSRAIGSLYKAAHELMDEAKERALIEVEKSRRKKVS